jgi:hypothetical protein
MNEYIHAQQDALTHNKKKALDIMNRPMNFIGLSSLQYY